MKKNKIKKSKIFLACSSLVFSFVFSATPTFVYAQNELDSEYKLNYKYIKGLFTENLQENIILCKKDKLCTGIKLPAGYFTLDKSIIIPSGFSLTGEGIGKTKIVVTPAFVGNLFSNSGTSTNISLSNLSLDLRQYTTKSRTVGVNLKNISNSSFRNLEIQNASSSGIYVTGGNNLFFENVLVNGSGKDGITMDKVSSSTIYKSIFTNNKGNGVTLLSTDQVNFQNSTTSKNFGVGLSLNGTSTKNAVYQSLISENQKAGISTSLSKNSKNSKNSLLENIIEKNGDDGITISLTDTFTVLNNNIRQNKNRGINIASSTHVILSKNNISDNLSEGILVGRGAEYIDILENKIIDAGFLLPIEKQGKSIGVNVINGAGHIFLTNNIIENTTDAKLQAYGLKVGDNVSYLFAKGNIIHNMNMADTKTDGEWGTKCVYDLSATMPRYQSLKCWFLGLVY